MHQLDFSSKILLKRQKKTLKNKMVTGANPKNHLYELDVEQFQKKVFWKIAIFEELEFGLINLVYQNFHSGITVCFTRNSHMKH